MPTTNARKHTIPSGADKSFNRATIFETFGNSIHDVVPVATTVERTQLVNALNAKGVGPSAANPVVVSRGDARGLHRIEYCMEATGTIWLPASGVLDFANKNAADSFGSSNPGLLTAGDRCRISGTEWRWSGAKWVPDGNGVAGVSIYNPPAPPGVVLGASLATLSGLAIANAPTGVPMLVDVSVIANNAGSGATRYVDIQVFNGANGVDRVRRFTLPYPITGGHQYAINYMFEVTPSAADWSLKLGADQAISVEVPLASLRLTMKP